MPGAGRHGVVDPLVGLLRRFAGQDSDRPAAGLFRSSRGGRHHFAAAAGHDRAASLGEKAPDLFGLRVPFAAAADNRDLNRTHFESLSRQALTLDRQNGLL